MSRPERPKVDWQAPFTIRRVSPEPGDVADARHEDMLQAQIRVTELADAEKGSGWPRFETSRWSPAGGWIGKTRGWVTDVAPSPRRVRSCAARSGRTNSCSRRCRTARVPGVRRGPPRAWPGPRRCGCGRCHSASNRARGFAGGRSSRREPRRFCRWCPQGCPRESGTNFSRVAALAYAARRSRISGGSSRT